MNLTATQTIPRFDPAERIVSDRQLTVTPFEISVLDVMEASQNLLLNRTERSSHFEIIWIRKGTGTLIADLREIAFEDSVVFCLAPGQQRMLVSSQTLEGYCLSLSPDFLNKMQGIIDFSIITSGHIKGNKVLVIKPEADQAREMKDVIVKMLREFRNYFSLRSEILKGLLKIFIIYLSRHVPEDTSKVSGRDAEMVSRFMVLICEHFTSLKKVSDYADKLCVTPNYLNQMVKRVSGYPASYHIQQQIVLEAKRQACCSSLKMKEIANSLGFQDYAHFSKFFKMYSGMSFSEFRHTQLS